MSVDFGVFVDTKEEGSIVRFPELKRSRIDKGCAATDHVGVDDVSRYKLVIRKKSKQKEHWWDAGMVLAARGYGDATVALMNIEEGRFEEKVATLHESMTVGMGFALVDSKLYAFGRRPERQSESADFFVCDLKFERGPYEFSKAGQLNGPKISPVVIPFQETKQILIIGTGHYRRGQGRDLPAKGPYCELLDLPSEENGGLYKCEPIPTPWDYTYDSMHGATPGSRAHAVVGNRVYIQIIAGEWNFEQRLYCFDMKTREWTEVKAPAQCPFLEPLDGFWRSLNDISRGKLFAVQVDRYDSEGMFFIGVTNLMDLNEMTSLECKEKQIHRRQHLKMIVPSLPTLQKFLTDNYSEYYGGAGWVMPLLPDDGDLFCLFVFLQGKMSERLLACKFKLREAQQQNSDVAAMDADNDIATPRKSSCCYDCEIMSHKLYDNTFSQHRIPLCAFTPAANYPVRSL